MVFDRSSINVGRTIQDFGLGDLSGVYRNTAKLRAKGWLIIVFFDASFSGYSNVIDALKMWNSSLPADKVTILGVGIGKREDLVQFAAANSVNFPLVWDYDDYVAATWSVSALPTIYLMDAGGRVLARLTGANDADLAEAKAVIETGIAKAAEKAAAEKAAADAAATPAVART